MNSTEPSLVDIIFIMSYTILLGKLAKYFLFQK